MRIRWWGHIVIWAALYIFWITIFQNHALTFSRTVTVEFCYLIFIAGNYYLHIFYSIPQLLYRNKYIAFGFVLLAGILLGSYLRTLLAMYITRRYFYNGNAHPHFNDLFFNSLLNISFWVISILAVHLIIEKIRFRKYMDLIEREKTKNELDFLKAQFNPHFLFNSINSIYGHIDKSNPVARNMLLTFSDMLRYQLYECNADVINIDKEINYIKNYVSIQQSRKGDSVLVNLHIDPNVKGFQIAPMLFIAFIENAFKYVSSELKENKVDICLAMDDDGLLFKTINTKEKHNRLTVKDRGIGIANVKRRLELLYANKYNLSINDCEDIYEVALKINLS